MPSQRRLYNEARRSMSKALKNHNSRTFLARDAPVTRPRRLAQQLVHPPKHLAFSDPTGGALYFDPRGERERCVRCVYIVFFLRLNSVFLRETWSRNAWFSFVCHSCLLFSLIQGPRWKFEEYIETCNSIG